MAEPVPLPSLAATAALYQTQSSRFIGTGSGSWERLLTADPRRYWVRFVLQAGAIGPIIWPGPAPTWSGLGGQTADQIYKWTDAPSVVSGEWYVLAPALAEVWIAECLYVGP